jgi:hypothetical protein
MEVKRRSERHKVKIEIRDQEKYNELDSATIQRFKRTNATEFNIKQIEKLKVKISDREEKLVYLLDRLRTIDTGFLDDELNENLAKSKTEIKAKTAETKRKKVENRKEKMERKAISDNYWKATIKASRAQRYIVKDCARSYKHFLKACDSIPVYMKRNLADMPNNKGYIWKSVYCYGDRKPERNKPTVLFEKKRGGILVIHEWTPREYRVYEKTGKERKVLVLKERRKPKLLNDGNLMDYIQK